MFARKDRDTRSITFSNETKKRLRDFRKEYSDVDSWFQLFNDMIDFMSEHLDKQEPKQLQEDTQQLQDQTEEGTEQLQ